MLVVDSWDGQKSNSNDTALAEHSHYLLSHHVFVEYLQYFTCVRDVHTLMAVIKQVFKMYSLYRLENRLYDSIQLISTAMLGLSRFRMLDGSDVTSPHNQEKKAILSILNG